MTKPDLTAAPFALDEAAIAWVRRTIDAMTEDELVGQLFINLNNRFDDAFVERMVTGYHPGGMRYNHTDSAQVQAHIRHAQSRSKVPLLVASNIEAGGNGACTDGTHVATPLQTASTPDTQAAYQLGLVGGRESRALGCNWAFTPIVDIHHNWRNTVIATRAFGDDHETVTRYAQAYSEGVRDGAGDRPMALCMKHFPGDGRDERDQHVVTSVNDCTVAEWDASYRRVWEWGIGAGIESVMVGHIMLPAYSRQLRPGIADADILPATVAPELLTDLLRDDLGFNGVILTDASLMVGLTSALPRERQLVQAINAGCDMILFFRNHDEDFGFVRDAVRSGEITADRLEDALTRILGLKAKLGLHEREVDDLVPPVDELAVVGSAEHRSIAAGIADDTIALLKDTAATLPLDPATSRRLRLYCLGSAPDFTGIVPEFEQAAVEELTAAGFEVSVYKTLHELAAEGQQLDMQSFLAAETEGYAEKYDAALILANVSDFAQQSALRIRWSMPMGPEMPWYAAEVPTVFVSLNLPNHLIDVPMVKTAINAHTPTAETVRALVAKLTGRSEFRGTHNENVWCGAWDTRR
ncbi:MAG: GH3 [uncultured Friedmanniella sp.]|uniref:beta-N-acetylhexosaminidase n=1 Tax=uncultured Friedmanniella sp. TaxID=335381 RepID=A0A6J4KWG8_9ACTN|nr:glycoside hydrolase family 3 N-terminal domain-containing protein [uncultured Friedmanniella sp.]CAA9316774.1 MAG: GH3 [uncultured Friedmanniella sp.]